MKGYVGSAIMEESALNREGVETHAKLTSLHEKWIVSIYGLLHLTVKSSLELAMIFLTTTRGKAYLKNVINLQINQDG